MGGLIVLIILVPVLILILLISILNRMGEQRRLMETMYDKVRDLGNEVAELSKELNEEKKEETEKQYVKRYQGKTFDPEKPGIKEEALDEPVKEPVQAIEPLYSKVEIPVIPEAGEEKQFDEIFSATETDKEQPKKNTDLEKFIGENLANKIGVTVLVLGIAFFVKYAIDKDWVKESGRVVIGLISGGILIGLAHYFRNRYRSFSSVLVGGGLTVFYFSIAFAFHQYHLIGQTAAFIIMVVISAFAVILSLFYNRQELAILATIGGFITPFLVNTGKENMIALFTYLSILNAGLIILSWFKRWPAINTIALFFTTIIFGGWLIRHSWLEDLPAFPRGVAFLFATLFYLQFVVMNIINTLRLKNKFTAFDFLIYLSINSLYYAAGMVLLSDWNGGQLKGIFTLSTGLFNLFLVFVFYAKKTVDRNFVSLLIGLAITFISLAVPVELKGNYIVLSWAAEAVVLLFLYRRTRIRLLGIASLIIAVLMLISLVLTWLEVYFYNETVLPVIFNKGFITTLVASTSLFLYYWQLRKEKDAWFPGFGDLGLIKKTILILAISVLYFSGLLELYYQFNTRYETASLHIIYLQAYTFAFAAVVLQFFKRDDRYYLLKLLLTYFCFQLYLVCINTTLDVSFSFLKATHNQGLFLAHWIAALILLGLLVDLAKQLFQKGRETWPVYAAFLVWATTAGIILVLSIEMYHILAWTNYHSGTDWAWYENLYYKAGLTILWSCCSFIMMWLGMKYKFRTFRIISLTLFTITLVKLFLFDIRNIPPGGKIAAFILLGILLLVVSFMYQRLKRIIIDESSNQ